MAQPIQKPNWTIQVRGIEELTSPKPNEETSFGDIFKRALGDAQDIQEESQRLITAFVSGEPVELHQVMAAAEEASISLELLVEIRNKLTDAYRTVMNMS
ncbi:MAG: flagellar hook-basal body complex protein FliE [Candidatus Eisenbacteria bacterium]|uniref:Flagellar hook-basal body complex protein FliE n=1 Tax=Eiseniibacteriota bacterium TaxID=2212470 RepID=A0A7Y2E8I3_UNCEI|nr:flagellar hook-basal body complex protein FliE [Candidatus Eisenbacteria bacterium]